MGSTASIGSCEVLDTFFKSIFNNEVNARSFKYTNQSKYKKMLNSEALNVNDVEERCAQGTCPDSGRKDYYRSLN